MCSTLICPVFDHNLLAGKKAVLQLRQELHNHINKKTIAGLVECGQSAIKLSLWVALPKKSHLESELECTHAYTRTIWQIWIIYFSDIVMRLKPSLQSWSVIDSQIRRGLELSYAWQFYEQFSFTLPSCHSALLSCEKTIRGLMMPVPYFPFDTVHPATTDLKIVSNIKRASDFLLYRAFACIANYA